MLTSGDIRDLILELRPEMAEALDTTLQDKGLNIRRLADSIMLRLPQTSDESNTAYTRKLKSFVQYVLTVTGNNLDAKDCVWLMMEATAQPGIFKRFWSANKQYIANLSKDHELVKEAWKNASISHKYRLKCNRHNLDRTVTTEVRSWIPGLTAKSGVI